MQQHSEPKCGTGWEPQQQPSKIARGREAPVILGKEGLVNRAGWMVAELPHRGCSQSGEPPPPSAGQCLQAGPGDGLRDERASPES